MGALEWAERSARREPRIYFSAYLNYTGLVKCFECKMTTLGVSILGDLGMEAR